MTTRRTILQACTVPGVAAIAGCAGFPFPIFDREEGGQLVLQNKQESSVSVTVTITSQHDDSFERVDQYDLEPDSRRVISEWLMQEGIFVVEAERENGRRSEADQVEGGRGTCHIRTTIHGGITISWQEGD